jgi:acetoin utilization deacetylase AcuC-like enzyme
VAIVDYDVHHGNGTQAAFIRMPRSSLSRLTSTRSIPVPAPADEIGAGPWPGFYGQTFPIEAGATDADYELVYSKVAFRFSGSSVPSSS